eukprot:Nk52_evm19s158 gene=Nk52_evmTU19s158
MPADTQHREENPLFNKRTFSQDSAMESSLQQHHHYPIHHSATNSPPHTPLTSSASTGRDPQQQMTVAGVAAGAYRHSGNSDTTISNNARGMRHHAPSQIHIPHLQQQPETYAPRPASVTLTTSGPHPAYHNSAPSNDLEGRRPLRNAQTGEESRAGSVKKEMTTGTGYEHQYHYMAPAYPMPPRAQYQQQMMQGGGFVPYNVGAYTATVPGAERQTSISNNNTSGGFNGADEARRRSSNASSNRDSFRGSFPESFHPHERGSYIHKLRPMSGSPQPQHGHLSAPEQGERRTHSAPSSPRGGGPSVHMSVGYPGPRPMDMEGMAIRHPALGAKTEFGHIQGGPRVPRSFSVDDGMHSESDIVKGEPGSGKGASAKSGIRHSMGGVTKTHKNSISVDAINGATRQGHKRINTFPSSSSSVSLDSLMLSAGASPTSKISTPVGAVGTGSPSLGGGSDGATQSTTVEDLGCIQAQLKKRKENHNEVERRRRDNINTCIDQLAELVPECRAMQDMMNRQKVNMRGRHHNKLNKGMVLRITSKYLVSLEEKVSSLEKKVLDLEYQLECSRKGQGALPPTHLSASRGGPEQAPKGGSSDNLHYSHQQIQQQNSPMEVSSSTSSSSGVSTITMPMATNKHPQPFVQYPPGRPAQTENTNEMLSKSESRNFPPSATSEAGPESKGNIIEMSSNYVAGSTYSSSSSFLSSDKNNTDKCSSAPDSIQEENERLKNEVQLLKSQAAMNKAHVADISSSASSSPASLSQSSAQMNPPTSNGSSSVQPMQASGGKDKEPIFLF